MTSKYESEEWLQSKIDEAADKGNVNVVLFYKGELEKYRNEHKND